MSYSKRVFSILFILAITAATAIIFAPSAHAAGPLNVPSAAYPTIQSALNAAKDGDTIEITGGLYNENINYDGYALAVSAGSSQPKTGITLQGSNDAIINGVVNLLYLKQFKIADLTVTGDLILGNGDAYGYVINSVVSDVQVGSKLTIGGSDNSVIDCKVKMLILKGGNTKSEFPALRTNIENNQLQGITIQAGSHNNTLKGNTVSHGVTGILEEPSKTYFTTGNNQFINNSIANCEIGISLYCSTGDNGVASHSADQFIQNTVRDNVVALYLSATEQFVVGNVFYYNNFMNNDIQVKINKFVPNVWDDGAKRGNYWSDYAGADQNGDGIGDTPYKIDALNKDDYPLIKSWPTPIMPTSTPTPTPSQSLSQPQSSNSVIPSSSQTLIPIAPEFTPLYALASLIAVSLLVIIVLKQKGRFTF